MTQKTNTNINADLDVLEYLFETSYQIGLAFYRKLAKKYHPDLGGDTKTMQMINSVYNYFKKNNKVHL